MKKANFGKLFGDTNNESPIEEIIRDKELMAEIRALGVEPDEISRYLSVLLRHKESRDACKHCRDLGSCKSDTIHLKTELILNDSGGLTVRMGPCPLKAKVNMIASNYVIADCPDEWIEEAKLTKTDRVTNIFYALQTAYKSDHKRWVYLKGVPGSGKSFLAVAFANAAAAKGHKVAIINSNTQFDEIKSMMIKNRSAAERRMEELAGVKVLIIDDFGSEFKSDYVRDQIVMPLLNLRSKSKGMTIFCSNYSLDDIEALYNTSRASAILAKQLVETIKRNCNGETSVAVGVEGLF